jgi:hypothetical protein
MTTTDRSVLLVRTVVISYGVCFPNFKAWSLVTDELSVCVIVTKEPTTVLGVEDMGASTALRTKMQKRVRRMTVRSHQL